MKRSILAAFVAGTMATGPAQAQTTGSANLETFVVAANRVPMNPTALLRADARRLMRQAQDAFRQVGEEHEAARAAARPTASCPPDKISVDAQQLLAFLNGIPQARRTRMTVTDGIRAWMVSRFPCLR